MATNNDERWPFLDAFPNLFGVACPAFITLVLSNLNPSFSMSLLGAKIIKGLHCISEMAAINVVCSRGNRSSICGFLVLGSIFQFRDSSSRNFVLSHLLRFCPRNGKHLRYVQVRRRRENLSRLLVAGPFDARRICEVCHLSPKPKG